MRLVKVWQYRILSSRLVLLYPPRAKGTVNLYSIQNVSVVVPFQQLHGQRAGVRDGDRFGHRIVLDYLGHILVALVATAPSHRVKAGAMEVYHRTTDNQPFQLLQAIYGNTDDYLGEGGLDISNDGTMIAVSSPQATQSGSQGKVSIYQVLANTSVSAAGVYLVQTIWGEASNAHLGLNNVT